MHIEDRVGITKLMYSSFLTYPQVRTYLRTLTREGLLEYDKLDKLYKISGKGWRLLRILNEINQMLKQIPTTV